MTNFIDRVILQQNGNFPSIVAPVDAVRKMWGFTDGKWDPLGFTDFGRSYLTIAKNTNNPPPTGSLNLFTYTVANKIDEPLLALDRGMAVKKDLSAGGYLASNQGALWLGSGLNNQLDIPKIILLNSGASLLNGGGFSSMPPIPAGYSGSDSFPSGQPSGTFYLRTDANEPYHNRVFKFNGSNWIDTTPTLEAAKQLFRSINAVFGKPADTIFESSCDELTHKWSWNPVGPASNYAGRNFDTLYLTKIDNTPAHLDVGNVSVHGHLGVGNTVTTSLSPATSNLALGSPTNLWEGLVVKTAFVNTLSPVQGPNGNGDYIDVSGTLRSTVNGVGYRSYYGGGGGGNKGGLCIDKYGNSCFVNGDASNYWSVSTTVDGTPILAAGYSNWVAVHSLSNVAGGTRAVYAEFNGRLIAPISSERYKENIQEIKDSSWLYDLKPVFFEWKDNERKKTDGLQMGLIAENVHSLCPELAWTDEKGQPEGVHYEKLAVPMLAEMKKLRTELNELKAKLATVDKKEIAA
jgi:hypothetical protein